MDNANLFDPEILYGDLSNDFAEMLSIKPFELIHYEVGKFKNLIYKHIERATTSGIIIPSFGEGDWLNTSRPLDFENDFKNRIFVMDFFTLCCINCIHILDYLKQVESEHAGTLNFAVIGVHSPKFENEKGLERVEEELSKYNIEHPVLNDPDLKVWKSFSVYCWPTVFIVGPGHTLLFTLVGEAQIDKLPFLCKHIIEYYLLRFSDYPVSKLPILTMDEVCGAGKEADSSLMFPGSVSTNGEFLAVSDTGHNRILIMSKQLKIEETIGSGLRGYQDGEFHVAKFNFPNGSTWYNGNLYLADTNNHCIRKIDFDSCLVTTQLKSEEASENFQSPWDVCIGPLLGTDLKVRSILYIAVAGTHQIWAADLDPKSESYFSVFAGSGKEENRANDYRMKAGFAQPSGITYSSLSPYHIYIADSESSTIKSIDLKNQGAVKIIVGGGRDPSDLFQFGDKGGVKQDCKLQHPMGITVIGKNLLAITDTYNHKVKIIDALKNECITLDQPLNMQRPCGLCFIDSQYSNALSEKVLYVCDSNNHRIVPIQIYESVLSNLVRCDFLASPYVIEIFNTESALHEIELHLDYDGIINCRFEWNLKNNMKINAEGSNCKFEHEGDGLFKVEFLSPGGAFERHAGIDPTLRLTSNKRHLRRERFENPMSSVKIKCNVVCCEDNSICKILDVTFEFLISFSLYGVKVIDLILNASSA